MTAGLLLSLANPPADAGPLAFVALVPLLWAIRGARSRTGALLAFVTGVVYYGLLVSWLLLFGVIAWLPLVVSQALYLVLFGALAPLLVAKGRPVATALGLAALWTAIDWARSVWPIGGFTWGGLGYTQHGNGLILPVATVTGVWGVTFLVVLVNALLLEAMLRAVSARPEGRGRSRARVPAAAGLVVLALGAALLPALIPIPVAGGPRLDVAVVQGNVPRALASDRLLQSRAVADNHIVLNRRLAADPPDLAVWPENALDADPTKDPALGAAVSASIRSVGAPTVVGAITDAPGGGYYNQALLYSGAGQVVGRYTKIHLVPFGEYIPFPSVLGWTQRYRHGLATLSPGDRVRTFRVDGARIGTPICFENTFPNLFRRFVAAGANIVVLTTNDSSYLLTPASQEHVIFSQMRAVETGRWIVQAAISGESAIVNPHGQVVRHTGLFRSAILRADVPEASAITLYTRFGDWFPWVAGLAVLLALAITIARRARREQGSGGDPPAGESGAASVRPGESRSRAAPSPEPIAGGAGPRVLVVLPTFNEVRTIERVVGGVLAAGPSVRALVIDDGSPDGTGAVADRLAAAEPRVRVLHRPGKRGLASAYLTGFRLGLDEGHDVIVEMDSDLSHRPEDLPALIAGARTDDLTIGSRYIPGGGVSNWSQFRVALSRAGNAYARVMLRIPVSDATSGFRAYRRELLEALVAEGVTSQGYGFQVELVFRAVRMGYRVGEVPITFRERAHGHSKISRGIVLEALFEITRWGVLDRFGRGPSRVA